MSEFRLRSTFLAVDFDNAAIKAAAFFFVFAQAFFHRGADLKFLAVFGNRRRNRPTGIARHVLFVNHGRGKTLNVGQTGAAQAAARGQKRNRFKNVGFAAAVFTGNNNRPQSGIRPQESVVSEIG